MTSDGESAKPDPSLRSRVRHLRQQSAARQLESARLVEQSRELIARSRRLLGPEGAATAEAGTLLERTERHLQQVERFIARQEALIAEFERDGHRAAAERARDVLANLRTSRKLALEHRQRVEALPEVVRRRR
jgi:hypothetical protein